MSEETLSKTEAVREEVPIEIDREIGIDTPVTMAQDGEGGVPPPMPPINPLVKPRGLPIFGFTEPSGGGYAIPPP